VNIPELVDKLCALAPGVMDECGFWTNERRCIIATRVGVETLRELGIVAEPCAVTVQAANKEFFKCAPLIEAKKMTGFEAKARGARLLCIDEDPTSALGGYPGHLVVALPTENVMVDLSAGQFDRPGIAVPRAVSMQVTSAFVTGKEPLTFPLPEGAIIHYRRLKNPPDWTTSPDWFTESRWRRIVRRLVKHLTLTEEKA